MTTAMDRVKYRFSTHCFQKVIDSLSEDQKGFLAKNGFEKFLGFRKFTVPMPFLEWVMGQVVIDSLPIQAQIEIFQVHKIHGSTNNWNTFWRDPDHSAFWWCQNF